MAYTFTLNGKLILPRNYNVHHGVGTSAEITLELTGRVLAGAGDRVQVTDSGILLWEATVNGVTINRGETIIFARDLGPIAATVTPFVYGDIVTWRNSHGAVPEHYMVVGPAASPGWVNLIYLDADEPYINDLWGNNFVRVP